jgi:hypothetical protein
MKHLFGFIWVFLGTICNRRSIYVIIIQNANDKRPLERPCLSLGLSDANYFSIWRFFCHGANFTILYVLPFFYTHYFR